MTTLDNFIAIDWHAEKDKIYFFLKENKTYSRFDIGDNAVPRGYPRPIHGNWGSFHLNNKDLRFGFTTTHMATESGQGPDQDTLWLFYYEDDTPMVCKYDQDRDRPIRSSRVQDSIWRPLLTYFDLIVAGTWWQRDFQGGAWVFRFLMSDGDALILKWKVNDTRYQNPHLILQPIDNTTWRGLEPYKHRIITAAQNDRTLADSYYYIFLTDNEYITYNIPENRVEYGPYKVSDDTWPGLLRSYQ